MHKIKHLDLFFLTYQLCGDNSLFSKIYTSMDVVAAIVICDNVGNYSENGALFNSSVFDMGV